MVCKYAKDLRPGSLSQLHGKILDAGTENSEVPDV